MKDVDWGDALGEKVRDVIRNQSRASSISFPWPFEQLWRGSKGLGWIELTSK